MAIRNFTVDGESVVVATVPLEGQGAIVIETYMPDGAGGHFVYRRARGRGRKSSDSTRDPVEVEAEKTAAEAEAMDFFNNLSQQEVETMARAALARRQSGTLPS